MNITQLIKLARDGKLSLQKSLYREHIRKVPQYKSKKWEMGNEDFYTITGYKKVPYKVFMYSAHVTGGEAYKITAHDFALLERILITHL